MILVLKGADFSANNLGTIRLSRKLCSYTIKAIEASGNTNLTDEQKFALDDLFIAMGADGSNDVMSKMRRVYLPIIAGDVSKALVNYNTSEFVVDKELTSDYWTLRSNGLVGVASGQTINLKETKPLLTDNFSSFFLRTEKMVKGVDDGSYVIVHRGKTNLNLFLGLRQQSGSSHDIISYGDYGAKWDQAYSKDKDVIKAAGVINSQNGFYCRMLGEWKDGESKAVTSDMSGETSQTVYVFGLNTVQTTKPYAVAMVGEAIDVELAKVICEKIDALYATFVP